MSERKACRMMKLSRTVYHYQTQMAQRDEPVVHQLQRLAGLHPGYGLGKMYGRLRIEGFVWNHKRVHRIYKNMHLNLRRKHKRRLPSRESIPMLIPQKPNEMWSMDFVHDSLYDGRRIRVLNVIEDFNRQALLMEADTSMNSRRITGLLDQLIEKQGKPMAIRTDNGPEFIGHVFLDWCHRRRIQHQFIQPGKPVQNSLIERFNGSYRKEILDAYVFYTLSEIRKITAAWMREYNSYRPHESLNNLTPDLYLIEYGKHENKMKNV